MNTKNFNYKNEEYDKVIKQITFSLKTINEKVFVSYFLKNISSSDKTTFINLLKKIDNSIIVDNNKIKETKNTFKKYLVSDFANYLVDYLIGYKEITPLISSKDIEEIMINDFDKVFVFCRDNICYKTNVVFKKEEYKHFINYLKNTLKKDFKEREFIDGVLPDQSRINIVSDNVAKINIITIRKYLKKPLTIVDLIKTNVLSSEIAAYLWVAIDGLNVKPANLFICGGTSTGKTTLVNVLLDFLPSDTRIISVEDTKEIDFSNFENNVCLFSNISNPDSLFDISVNILRMRPDRIIIGETRGKEAKALFSAMACGHEGCISTIHANNVKELVNKLASAPFNIEESYLSLLNVVVVLKKIYVNNKIKRFISQVSEIQKIGKITTNDIYLKENSNIVINLMSSSYLEKVCEILNISKIHIKKIIEHRIDVINDMVENNITDQKEIRKIIKDNSYF